MWNICNYCHGSFNRLIISDIGEGVEIVIHVYLNTHTRPHSQDHLLGNWKSFNSSENYILKGQDSK